MGTSGSQCNTINPFCASCQPNSENILNENIEFIFLQLDDEAFVWFHSKDFYFQHNSIYRQYLHYRHFDFRKFKEYNRVAYDVHLEDEHIGRELVHTA